MTALGNKDVKELKKELHKLVRFGKYIFTAFRHWPSSKWKTMVTLLPLFSTLKAYFLPGVIISNLIDYITIHTDIELFISYNIHILFNDHLRLILFVI